jgi:hypothetical protein
MERNSEHDPLEREGPAGPEQTQSGYAEGLDHKPDPPEEELEPDFARGLREGPESEVEERGRFSEGVEQLPETPEKTVERRFSEGLEENPTSE